MTPSSDINSASHADLLDLLKQLDAVERKQCDDLLLQSTFSLIQQEALKALLAGTKTVVVCGANQSGKTTLGAIALLIFMTRILPKAIQVPAYEHTVTPRGDFLSLALDFTSSYAISQAKVLAWCPARLQKHFNKEFRILTLKNDATCLFKSVDSGWEKLQGFEVDGIWLDEEPRSEMIWNESYMRTIKRKGFMLMTFSPLKGLSWAYQELYLKACSYTSTENIHGIKEDVGLVHTLEEIAKLKERRLVAQPNASDVSDPNIQFFQMTVYDNIHLPDEEIQNAERKYKDDPLQYQARILGRFTRLVGREVFPVEKLLQIQAELRNTGTRYDLLEGGTLALNPQGKLTIFQEKQEGAVYVIGADVAEGLEKGNYSCAQVLKRATMEQVAVWHGHCSPEDFATILVHLGRYYNTAKLAPESNFHGIGVLSRLRHDYKYPNVYAYYDEVRGTITGQSTTAPQKKFGWLTTARTKPIMIQALAAAIQSGRLKLNDRHTIDELTTFIYSDNGKMEALGGCYDDRVMSLAIALMVAKHTSISKYRGDTHYETILYPSIGY